MAVTMTTEPITIPAIVLPGSDKQDPLETVPNMGGMGSTADSTLITPFIVFVLR